eukprot:scaffold78719_cov17-Tisochrysis_lutea.AAC.2
MQWLLYLAVGQNTQSFELYKHLQGLHGGQSSANMDYLNIHCAMGRAMGCATGSTKRFCHQLYNTFIHIQTNAVGTGN